MTTDVSRSLADERRSLAHKGDYSLKTPFLASESYSDGSVPYRKRDDEHWHCSFCGSLHPSDLVTLLKAGATLSPADRKYGWPHKFYVERASWGKFYTVHLVDATPEERDIIERAMGLHISFEGDSVRWQPYSPLTASSTEVPK